MESVNVNKYNKRNPAISIAKAIGIILMVIGHVFDKESWGIHYIYMFHMPLFFVLSGYFFKHPTNIKDVKIYIWKRIKGLYFPFIKWTLFFILIHNLLLRFHIGNGLYDFRLIVLSILKSSVTFVGTEPVLVGFWFLKALFTAAVFYQILSYVSFKFRLSKVILPMFLLLLVLVQMMLCNKNKTLLGMNLGALFMYVGTVIKNYSIEKKVADYKVNVLLALLILVVSRSYTDVFYTEMLQVNKTTVLPFILTGSVGSLLVLSISNFSVDILRNKIRRYLVYIGDHSLIILALHYPFIKILDYYFVINIGEYTTIQHISGGGNWSACSYCVIPSL